MARRNRSMVVAVLAVTALSACGTAGAVKQGDGPPARVVRVKGTNLRRVILTPRAIERLGVTTVRIAAAGAPGGQTVVPYAAVLYDPSGRAWVYASAKPRTYQRARITIDRVDGDRAYLSAGPDAGTPVVVVGAAEVYGTEFFSAHE